MPACGPRRHLRLARSPDLAGHATSRHRTGRRGGWGSREAHRRSRLVLVRPEAIPKRRAAGRMAATPLIDAPARHAIIAEWPTCISFLRPTGARWRCCRVQRASRPWSRSTTRWTSVPMRDVSQSRRKRARCTRCGRRQRAGGKIRSSEPPRDRSGRRPSTRTPKPTPPPASRPAQCLNRTTGNRMSASTAGRAPPKPTPTTR